MNLNTDLRYARHQIMQTVGIRSWQAVPDDDNHLPTWIGLGGQAGLGDGLKQAQTFFHALGGIKKRKPVFCCLMSNLKAAQSRV